VERHSGKAYRRMYIVLVRGGGDASERPVSRQRSPQIEAADGEQALAVSERSDLIVIRRGLEAPHSPQLPPAGKGGEYAEG